MTTLSNLAALAAINTNLFPKNHEIFVETYRDTFIVDKNSTEAADAGRVVVPAAGPGRLVRALNRPHPSWRAQLTWFIDPVSGNDENTGLTSGVPIKTNREWLRRVGTTFSLLPSSSYTLRWLSNVPTTDPFNCDVRVPDGSRFDTDALPTVVRSSTFGTVTALNSATQQPLTITDGSFDFTSNVFRQIRISSGARAGAYTWVAKAVSAGTARLGNMCTNGINYDTSLVTYVTPVAADPYDIRTLLTVPIGQVSVSSIGNTFQNSKIFSFSNLHLSATSVLDGHIGGANPGCTVVLSGCYLDAITLDHPSIIASNCRNSNDTIVRNGVMIFDAGIVDTANLGLFGGTTFLDGHILGQGNGLAYGDGPSNIMIGQCCAFDNASSTTSAIHLVGGSRTVRDFPLHGATLFWGTNNTARALTLLSGSHFHSRVRPTCNAGLGLGREVYFANTAGGDDVLWADCPMQSTNDSSVSID